MSLRLLVNLVYVLWDWRRIIRTAQKQSRSFCTAAMWMLNSDLGETIVRVTET